MIELNAFRRRQMADRTGPQPLHLIEENDQPNAGK